MKTIKNKSPHRPKDMLVDVADEDFMKVLKTGEFISADIKEEKKEDKEEKKSTKKFIKETISE